MVNVEKRALRPFKQDAVAGAAALVKDRPDTVHERQDLAGNLVQFGKQCFGLDFLNAKAAPQWIVMRKQPVNLGRQACRIGKIHHLDRTAPNLVLIGRANAAAGRADLGAFSCVGFPQPVEFAVNRQDQRRVLGNFQK